MTLSSFPRPNRSMTNAGVMRSGELRLLARHVGDLFVTVEKQKSISFHRFEPILSPSRNRDSGSSSIGLAISIQIPWCLELSMPIMSASLGLCGLDSGRLEG